MVFLHSFPEVFLHSLLELPLSVRCGGGRVKCSCGMSDGPATFQLTPLVQDEPFDVSRHSTAYQKHLLMQHVVNSPLPREKLATHIWGRRWYIFLKNFIKHRHSDDRNYMLVFHGDIYIYILYISTTNIV